MATEIMASCGRSQDDSTRWTTKAPIQAPPRGGGRPIVGDRRGRSIPSKLGSQEVEVLATGNNPKRRALGVHGRRGCNTFRVLNSKTKEALREITWR